MNRKTLMTHAKRTAKMNVERLLELSITIFVIGLSPLGRPRLVLTLLSTQKKEKKMKLRLPTVALSISMLFMMACGGETDKRAFADSDYDYCVSNWQEDVVKEVDYADLQASYQPNQWYSMLVDLAGRSYPDMGATFVKAMSEKKWINLGWVEPGQTDTFESGVLEQVNTAVHEAP